MQLQPQHPPQKMKILNILNNIVIKKEEKEIKLRKEALEQNLPIKNNQTSTNIIIKTCVIFFLFKIIVGI